MNIGVSDAGKRHEKDSILDNLASNGNVAQFVSFGPGTELHQRYLRIRGYLPNARLSSAPDAIAALLQASSERRVNVRTFRPEQPKGGAFLYGLSNLGEILEKLRDFASQGLHTIVNETIDVSDGGVSGVAIANMIEFAPLDTPRCVERPGCCSLPRELGLRLLRQVYGFLPKIDYQPQIRAEFSIHPLRCGFLHEHTIIWELEDIGSLEDDVPHEIIWPNRFSRFIGDKAFGLLVADALGLPVPKTNVIARNVAPFVFGQSTGSNEIWMRTCPIEPEPGKYTTQFGWLDPFELLRREDERASKDEPMPQSYKIASVLSQQSVDAIYSGAMASAEDDRVLIEGVAGRGDNFMLGRQAPEKLPPEVRRAVEALYSEARLHFKAVRMEWVYDGAKAWAVQLHGGAHVTQGRTIVPGSPAVFRTFEVGQGLDELRNLITSLPPNEGILLVGDVGITSHFGDVLRRARVPSRIESN